MRLSGTCRIELKKDLVDFLVENKITKFGFKEDPFKKCTYSIILSPPLATDFLILKHKLTLDLNQYRKSKGWWWRLWN